MASCRSVRWLVAHVYNAAGNRKTMVTGAGTTQYAYDAADRLTSVTPPGAGAISYTFDDNGNLTDRGSDDFAWDAEDRLTSATVSSVTTAFTYNGQGLRASLTANSTTTTFTWDINASSPQLVDDGTLKYVYGLGRISQLDGTDQYYFLPDALGSTMAMTDEDGDVVNSYEYDVFGAIRDSTGSVANAFTFAGRTGGFQHGPSLPSSAVLRQLDRALRRQGPRDAARNGRAILQ